jgi:hypothetical protein
MVPALRAARVRDERAQDLVAADKGAAGKAAQTRTIKQLQTDKVGIFRRLI